MFDWFRNVFSNHSRYRTNSRAVIISCFYNPQNSPYRLLAFQKWFHSIKHLNFRVLECLIDGAKKQLPDHPSISTVSTESLLWHKETLLNKIVADLPDQFDYVFWVDADVLFTNLDWLAQGVEKLQHANLIQPFEWCVHLNKNKEKPDFDLEAYRGLADSVEYRHSRLWRSFCASHVLGKSTHLNYDLHGHVGFAWGARREVLEKCPLYDRALIGGSDHILAHAAVGHLDHACINKSFTDNLDEVTRWMHDWYGAVQGNVDYVPGDLYHIWHGDIQDRQYLQRIRDFTGMSKDINERDENGLHVVRGSNDYMRRYYGRREVTHIYEDGFDDFAAGFAEDMGYAIADIITLFGEPRYADEPAPQPMEAPVQGFQPEPVQGFVPPADVGPASVPEIQNLVSPLDVPVAVESQNFS